MMNSEGGGKSNPHPGRLLADQATLPKDVLLPEPSQHATDEPDPNVARRAPSRFRRILLCLDRSAQSEQSLPSAINIARCLDAPLCLLHVQEKSAGALDDNPDDALDWEISCLESKQRLQELEQVSGSVGVDVETAFAEGGSADRILEISTQKRPCLIVVSRQGAGHAAQYGLGGTAQKVISLAKCSVMILPTSAPTHVEDEVDSRWKRILVPLDSSLRGECVLPTAVKIAKDNRAELLLLHVLQTPPLTGPRPHPLKDRELARRLEERNRVAGQHYIEHVAEGLRLQHDRVRPLTASGSCPRQTLSDAIKSSDADLAIISAHGETGNAAWRYGTLTAHLIQNSPIPLLVMQDMSHKELSASDPKPASPAGRPVGFDHEMQR